MVFLGEGKRTFADSDGPYLTVRFVGGRYETTDPTEIKLLRMAGCREEKEQKHGARKEGIGAGEVHSPSRLPVREGVGQGGGSQEPNGEGDGGETGEEP